MLVPPPPLHPGHVAPEDRGHGVDQGGGAHDAPAEYDGHPPVATHHVHGVPGQGGSCQCCHASSSCQETKGRGEAGEGESPDDQRSLTGYPEAGCQAKARCE